MKRKWKVGCLVVAFYCAGCSILLGTHGGFFSVTAEMSTLHGGHLSKCDVIVARSIDIVTAPVQIAILAPLFAVNYVCEHTGERGRELAKIARQKEMCERYVKLLREDFDRIYVEREFLNPSNEPAMKALGQEKYRLDAASRQRYAEFLLEHRELMLPQREFWRICKVPAFLHRRALAIALDFAGKNSSEDVKWLVLGIMNACAEESIPGCELPYVFSGEELQGYVTNEIEIVRWSARAALKNRTSYRDHLRRHEEHLREMRNGR